MSYQRLESHFAKIGRLQEVEAILQWDQAVNMPDAAGESRAEALATLSVTWHEWLSEPAVMEWVLRAESEDLEPWQHANLDAMRRLSSRARAVPLDLVEARSKANSSSEQAWRALRKQNDFASFVPYLKEVVARTRDAASLLGEVLGLTPYDALLDEFEPGIRAARIDEVFAPLAAFLPEFTRRVLDEQRGQRVVVPEGPFDQDAQRRLGVTLMEAVGFDLTRGRLDTSQHPFCGGVPRDVRITTRYDVADFSSALMGILHEAGHGKYEQGLPQKWHHQPVGVARGMVLHESQSLLLEMQISRGRPFLTFALPKIVAAFPERALAQTRAFELDNVCRWVARVQPSFIRVDADEVTYPSHVLLRYEIERDLISGSLSVEDLPEAWHVGMQRFLGLSTRGNDRDGCLQDVHWPSGLFGYFPLYTLGAMVAAQLFGTIERVHPEVHREIERGNFDFVDVWLGEHVWSRASSASTEDILRDATGEGLNPDFFRRHLTNRYLSQEPQLR